MQSEALRFEEGFSVVFGNARAQAAQMTIPPGGAEGNARNRHVDFDQWLFVVEGVGQAIIEGQSHALAPGVLLLIERGERHEIRNDGSGNLKTLNFYAPPGF